MKSEHYHDYDPHKPQTDIQKWPVTLFSALLPLTNTLMMATIKKSREKYVILLLFLTLTLHIHECILFYIKTNLTVISLRTTIVWITLNTFLFFNNCTAFMCCTIFRVDKKVKLNFSVLNAYLRAEVAYGNFY